MIDISGHTKPFAVLGHPIGHSLSPVMHNAGIQTLKMDAIYLAFDVHPEKLMDVLPAMRDMGFGGVNLTVPLKEVAFRGLDDLSASALQLGAVNTVEFLDDGSMRGHNTDGAGFLLAIKEAFETSPKDLSIFVLGSGGAGRAVAITCATEGAGSIAVSDIDNERSNIVAKEISLLAPATTIEPIESGTENWHAACSKADLIIHATPIGMKPDDESLLSSAAFKQNQMVFDLIYMRPQTPFTLEASKAGARTQNGLGMLLHQGAHAFEIWTGKTAAVDAMREALEKAVY